MFKKFLTTLAEDVYYGHSGRDTDHPICPNCGGRMTFHGGDLTYGEGYWDCDSCDYSFTEDELQS